MSEPLSVPEAAAALGVSERTIWRWLESGRLSADRSGGRVHVSLPSDERARAIAEAKVAYGTSLDAMPVAITAGAWPYTAENVEKRKAIVAARRRHAVETMDRLSRETRPDPDGLTGVDYIRELRGPIGDDVDEDDGPVWGR